MKANWISYILHKNCFLKHVIEREERRKHIRDWKMRKRFKWLQDDLKERKE
jgi:hypothetical protein